MARSAVGHGPGRDRVRGDRHDRDRQGDVPGEVRRGKAFEQWTAFDPQSKRFDYLTWKRGEPKPVSTIWDHKTGEAVKLHKFPDVEQPLPVIPSMEDMKVCPLTGDKKFTTKKVLNYD